MPMTVMHYMHNHYYTRRRGTEGDKEEERKKTKKREVCADKREIFTLRRHKAII